MTPAALQEWRSETDPARKKRLLNAIVKGEDALVERCARKMARSDSELDDLMQCGRMGVLKAIEKFDPSRLKYGTFERLWKEFAKQWVLDGMDRGVARVRDIAPVAAKRLNRSGGMPKEARREARRIEATTGRPATAVELGVSEAVLAESSAKPRMFPLSGNNSNFGEYFDMAYMPRIPAPLILSPDQTILTDSFWRALASLTDTESRVFCDIVIHEKQVKEVAASEGHEERWATATYRRAVEKMRAAMSAVPAP